MTRNPTAPLGTGASSVGDLIAFHSWEPGCDDEAASSQPSRSSAVLSLDELHPGRPVAITSTRPGYDDASREPFSPTSTDRVQRVIELRRVRGRSDLYRILGPVSGLRDRVEPCRFERDLRRTLLDHGPALLAAGARRKRKRLGGVRDAEGSAGEAAGKMYEVSDAVSESYMETRDRRLLTPASQLPVALPAADSAQMPHWPYLEPSGGPPAPAAAS